MREMMKDTDMCHLIEWPLRELVVNKVNELLNENNPVWLKLCNDVEEKFETSILVQFIY
jgi:hypothetical protein